MASIAITHAGKYHGEYLFASKWVDKWGRRPVYLWTKEGSVQEDDEQAQFSITPDPHRGGVVITLEGQFEGEYLFVSQFVDKWGRRPVYAWTRGGSAHDDEQALMRIEGDTIVGYTNEYLFASKNVDKWGRRPVYAWTKGGSAHDDPQASWAFDDPQGNWVFPSGDAPARVVVQTLRGHYAGDGAPPAFWHRLQNTHLLPDTRSLSPGSDIRSEFDFCDPGFVDTDINAKVYLMSPVQGAWEHCDAYDLRKRSVDLKVLHPAVARSDMRSVKALMSLACQALLVSGCELKPIVCAQKPTLFEETETTCGWRFDAYMRRQQSYIVKL